MLNKKKIISSILIIFAFYFQAQSQSIAYNIFELNFLYNEAKYEQVLIKSANLMTNQHSLSKDQLIEIHKYRALSYFAIGKQDSARINFYSILSIEKDFKLDPIKISPKILVFFNAIRDNFERDTDQKKIIPYNSYIFVEDIRPYAAFRSAILPGWGQHYKEQNTKGYILNGAFAFTSIATFITYLREKNLKEDYLSESNPSKITSLYADYNNTSKARRILQYTVLTVWAFSIFDALYTDYTPSIMISEKKISLALSISLKK